MNIFISGGNKNGKSYYAQVKAREMAAAGKPLYYIATMMPRDEEDIARIEKHIQDRDGWGFKTIEQPVDICACLESRRKTEEEFTVFPEGIFLLDSITALLSNEMFRADGSCDMGAPSRVTEELCRFAELTGNTVFVSDYIYSDAIVYDELTEAYRQGLAMIDRTLAKICHKVVEISMGNKYEYNKQCK